VTFLLKLHLYLSISNPGIGTFIPFTSRMCFPGIDLEEVKDNIKEAIEVYLESQEKDVSSLKKMDRIVLVKV
jgi:predicted RNase H-like HicB family nuclease